MSHEKDDVSDLAFLCALVAEMRRFSSRPVVDAGEMVMERIVETYLAPNRSLSQIKDMPRSGALNFLLEFGEACRGGLR
ncbi:hypothetical protein [Rhizobium grahamii]|uniref:Uncharacterized protein n=1 Tax=Rhizobium grahamii CCGE 502 TaxID=990285 RepID=S3IAF2_9HYPH|nr:hypothetical protein RGCCGE502_21250 [Rhizobium grahamii CCGE 502]